MWKNTFLNFIKLHFLLILKGLLQLRLPQILIERRPWWLGIVQMLCEIGRSVRHGLCLPGIYKPEVSYSSKSFDSVNRNYKLIKESKQIYSRSALCDITAPVAAGWLLSLKQRGFLSPPLRPLCPSLFLLPPPPPSSSPFFSLFEPSRFHS